MSKLTRILVATIAIASVLQLSGCSDDNHAGLKVYKFGLDGAPTNLDPVAAGTIYANFMVINTYDTLYSYKYLKRPYELKTNLASDLPEISDDGLTYTIPIKEGAFFIDDEAFPE